MTKKNNKKSGRVQSQNHSDSILECYLKDINRIPLMTRDEEIRTAKEAAKGNKIARDKLINANLRFVIRIAKKYQGHGLPLTDLINEGNIGLIKAVEHFDADRGFHFISYAVWWVRQTILTAIAEKSRMIRMPLYWNSKFIQMDKSKDLQKETQPGSSDLMEMARDLGIEADKLKDVMIFKQEILSLDHPAKDGEKTTPIGDFLESGKHTSPEVHVMKNALQDDIEKVLDTLNYKEAAIIKARFGLEDGIARSLEEIGEHFKLSKEGVRQIEKRALKQLRQRHCSSVLEPYVA
ncbi:MAG: RNA polymerase sigma factor RpoD/SigA [Treponema sp.]|nr:RNA polymerase sigma factor RpoD/SigA [Treponema sp.]